jgi:hypothetical protein
MDWLGSDHVGTPIDTHTTICAWSVPKVYKWHGRLLGVVQLSVGDRDRKFIVEEGLEASL